MSGQDTSFQMPEWVLFDLDGTLVDNFGAIYRSCNYAFVELGLAEISYETLLNTVGGGIRITMGKLIGELHADEAVSLFRAHFDRIWQDDLRLLPGVHWLMAHLKSAEVKTLVFTNKEGTRAREIIRYLGLEHCFDKVIGTLDTPWCKPQPEFTRYALDQVDGLVEGSVLIGDSPFDVASADAVNMKSYGVATGSHSLEQLRESGAVAAYRDLFHLGQELFGFPEAAEDSA